MKRENHNHIAQIGYVYYYLLVIIYWLRFKFSYFLLFVNYFKPYPCIGARIHIHTHNKYLYNGRHVISKKTFFSINNSEKKKNPNTCAEIILCFLRFTVQNTATYT